MERWAEYVEELYKDENREQADVSDVVNEDYVISSDEIETVIKNLPKGKSCCDDNISAELLQGMGEKGLEIMKVSLTRYTNQGTFQKTSEKVYLYQFQKSVEHSSAMILEQSR